MMLMGFAGVEVRDGVDLVATGSVEMDSTDIGNSSFPPVDAYDRKDPDIFSEKFLQGIFSLEICQDICLEPHGKGVSLAAWKMR